MKVDLPLLERWLTGWSLGRGLPLPTHAGGGLAVEVGWPDQLRRHVFVDAGPALRECASRIDAPFIHLKAAVDADELRRALPAHWTLESPRHVMSRDGAAGKPVTVPAGYVASVAVERGMHAVRLTDSTGQIAASGYLILHQGTAIFDRIETFEPHRRKGLGTALMATLDALAADAGASERLLIATDEGRALYLSLGWQVLAPYATAISPPWRPALE